MIDSHSGNGGGRRNGRKKTAGEKTWRGGWNETFDSNDDDAGSGDGDSGHSICRGNAAVKRDSAAAVWPIHREVGVLKKGRCTFRRQKPKKGEEIMNHMQSFFMEEDGVGVVEIILILVVLIGLVVIFKKQITNVVKSILSKISSQSEGI